MNMKKYVLSGIALCIGIILPMKTQAMDAVIDHMNIVVPPPIILCPFPTTLGDESPDAVTEGSEPTLQNAVTPFGMNVGSDQKQYQAWAVPSGKQANIEVKLNSKYAALGHVFGIYKNTDASGFMPLFKVGDVPGFESVQENNGSVYSTSTGATVDFGFAIKTSEGNFFATRNSLNSDGSETDHTVSFNLSSNKYVIAFEDLAGLGDSDFNDMVVEANISCSPITCIQPNWLNTEDSNETWDVSTGETVTVTLDSFTRNASWNSVFGYYKNGDFETFTPIFKTGDVDPTYAGVPTVPEGAINQQFVITPGISTVSFAIKAWDGSTYHIAGTELDDSEGSLDRAHVETSGISSYSIAFEDATDADFNDLVLNLTFSCGKSNDDDDDPDQNSPPTVTLIGDATITVNKDSEYVDQNALYSDPEDTGGSSILVSSSGSCTTTGLPINTSIPGTYPITYSCTDGGGLSANATRTVIVNGPPIVTVIGENPLTVTLGSSYGELGATATDAEDNPEPTPVASGTVDATTIGTYAITYTATDSGGLVGIATRTVLVSAACSDGKDNDGDAKFDYPSDPGCSESTDNDESNGDEEIFISKPPTPPSGGGGGSSGRRNFGTTTVSLGRVLGATTDCGLYLYDYIKYGAKNNPDEVKKLQSFLNEWMGANLPIDGTYSKDTFKALEKFQIKYKGEILKPWTVVGLHKDENTPTGYVYKTTQRMINNLVCPSLNLPIPNLKSETR